MSYKEKFMSHISHGKSLIKPVQANKMSSRIFTLIVMKS